jgi:TonB family protein
MIAIWMLYVSALSLCFGIAALALERAARLWAKPRRLVWALAIAASLIVPAVGLTIPRAPNRQPAAPGSVPMEGLAIGQRSTAEARSGGTSSADAKIGPLMAALNRPLLLLWGCASVALALGLLRAGVGLRRRARGWRATTVDGAEVLVAPDIGPAVVRLGGLKIVLPEWALSAEPAARSLMLLHENEHRGARDPDLLLGAMLALTLVPWALPLWWHVRRLQLAVETDCDRRVMRAGADARAYGVLLLSVGARATGQPLLAPTAFAEAPTLLERRIEAMTSPSPERRLVRTALAASLGALGVAAACMAPRPAAAPAQQPSGVPAEHQAASPAQQILNVYSEDSVTDRPERISGPMPKYPDILRLAGVGGRVVVEAVVDTLGHPERGSVRILSSTNALFDQPSEECVAATVFRPGRLAGRVVRVRVHIPINYRVSPGPPAPQPPSGVLSEDSVTQRPQLLSRPPLTWPDSLRAAADSFRAAGVGARLVVEAVVDSTGHVDSGSVHIVWRAHSGFDAAAREAVIASAYAPGRRNGHAVPVLIRFLLEFEPPAAATPHD